MIIWSIKLLSNVRRAIAGRRYPSQLAWAVAFGLLLGIVPHGNLLAVVLLVVVLSLRLNHAMAGLTAIGTTFAASYIDPYSHQLGSALLASPDIRSAAEAAWTLPLIPWTNLNNTIVLGSLGLGIVALVPVFLVSYPVFRLLAWLSPLEDEEGSPDPAPAAERAQPHQIVHVEGPHTSVTRPNYAQSNTVDTVDTVDTEGDAAASPRVDSADKATPPPSRETNSKRRRASRRSRRARGSGRNSSRGNHSRVTADARRVAAAEEVSAPAAMIAPENFIPIAQPAESAEIADPAAAARSPGKTPAETPDSQVAIETRIDVIRMQDYCPSDDETNSDSERSTDSAEPQPMDEALNYLLRQLRDSQQRKAA